jgi:isocitrate dehydrogenase (NAD+)
LPNLYGDIITDEAAEFQEGLEPPVLPISVKDMQCSRRYTIRSAYGYGRPSIYADPCSMLRAAVMLLNHIGQMKKAEILEKALDFCMYEEKK